MNVNKLKAKCTEKGINIDTLSKGVDIGRSSFYRRMKKNAFSVEEAKKIAKYLGLKQQDVTDIFFEDVVA